QCMVWCFLLDLLKCADVVPYRNMEGVCIIVTVCNTRNDSVAFFIHTDKSTGQALCRCCKQCKVHLGFLASSVAVSTHVTNDLQTFLLHLVAFAVVMTIKSG